MKRCSKCKLEKRLDEFHNCKSKKDGKQPYCKSCLIVATKKDYRVNNRKRVFSERAKAKRDEIRGIFNSIRAHNVCAFCDESTLCCLDFHHLDPKQKDLSVSRLSFAKSKDRMLKEMQKCVVVCSNCHRKIHAGLLEPSIDQLCEIPDLEALK